MRAVESPTRFITAETTGRVRTTAGFWVPFQIQNWEEGSYWDWRVAGVTATGHRVRSVDRTCCEVTFTVPAWAPVYLPVCAAALRRLERLVTRESG